MNTKGMEKNPQVFSTPKRRADYMGDEGLAAWIETRIVPVPEAGCWLWEGATSTAGYGQFRTAGKLFYVHRWLFERSNGALLAGECVCHRCDNRLCVNVDHMFRGTKTDNNRDMFAKKRDNHHKILSDAQVSEIRQSGEKASVLAQRYPVTENYIHQLLSNPMLRCK